MDVCVLGRIGYDLYAVEHGRPLSEVEHFVRRLGGSSANIAVGLARLGLKVGIISSVGKDALADYLIGFLRQEGVDTEYVHLVEGYNTSLCLTEVSPPDRFPQVFYRREAADTRLAVGEDELEYVKRARTFVTNGTSLSASPSRESTVAALKAARGNGLCTVLDIDYRASSWPSATEAGAQARAVMPWVDIIIGNEDEVALLTGGEDTSRLVRSGFDSGVKVLVRKLGARGVEAYTGNEHCVAQPKPTKVMSTIGAGDGFAAGFLFALDRNLPLDECLRYGNAAAAVVVSRVSCSDAMPYPDELRDALDSE